MPRDPSSPHPDDEQAKDEEEVEVSRVVQDGEELDDDDLDDLFDLDDLDLDEEEDEGEGPDA